MKKIGVIGAGVMGAGVSYSVAYAGYQVVLVDLTDSALQQANVEVRKNSRMHMMFGKSEEKCEPDQVISNIQFTTDYNQLKDVDLVIENVTEKWEIKRDVYLKLDEICPEHCLFAVNTSCISITRVGGLTKRRDKVIGAHFMNPVPLKPVIEVIKGEYTSEETISAFESFLKSIDKSCIVVNDYPGFVSNRLSHLLMNEAAFVVQDGVATAEQVDDIFKMCFGHKLGPLETADLIGLDTVMDSLDVLYQEYQDPKFRCSSLLRKKVYAGMYGRKSGEGFYTY